MNNFKKLYILSLIAGVFVNTSCKKDGIIDRAESVNGNALLKIYHLSPDAPTLNFYANNQKITAVGPNTAGAEQGIAFSSIFPGKEYFALPAGTSAFKAVVPASSTVLPGAVLNLGSAEFKANSRYSVFVIGKMSEASTLIIEDDVNVPDPTKAYIRFISTIPTEQKLDVTYTQTNVTPNVKGTVFSSASYKEIKGFQPIEPSGVYTLTLDTTATTGKVLGTFKDFVPVAGRKYTLISTGILGGTGSQVPNLINSTNKY
ncbi:DUF4397 domain-containing protein [Solitalea lacus]|uniref:DUF4397 domain-containing protein n=1 Tax=Solitalea lacus TaxID=2911172 RepID=UPI001EDC2016|nr:DUF4397 domain-containing protein [Solitalea lacus]UKJ07252.1 DUF4397 domain-containing protein [Solitalea lacus]